MIVASGRVRLRVKLVVAGVATLALLAGAWVWLRDSSFVAVKRVTVTGVSGPDAARIRSALVLSARNMTTLDVHVGQLKTVVAPYPMVKNLQVSTQFPHGMRIQVIEDLPVGVIVAGGESIAASSDGTLLRDAPTASLPQIPLQSFPGGSRLTDPSALGALALLAAAPDRLLSRISQVTTIPPHGLVVALRSGPSLYFGDAGDLGAKWTAATEVLAAPTSAGATYIDVTDPAHPVAGVSSGAVSAAGLAAAPSQAATDGTPQAGVDSQPSTSTPGT
ncbi:MAG TPA: FtsQ-type POTRA domain-containing protein [Solirubrobacteraceae bacterium]|jgi:cell division protein FtsQ